MKKNDEMLQDKAHPNVSPLFAFSRVFPFLLFQVLPEELSIKRMKEVNVAFFMVSHLLNLCSSVVPLAKVGIHHEQQASSIGLCTLSFSLFYAEEAEAEVMVTFQFHNPHRAMLS